MVMQWPWLRIVARWASSTSAAVRLPRRNSSSKRQVSVPAPTSRPRKFPGSIGPPETMMVGRSTLAAPMSCAGVVLSQPESSTTPSSGLARRVSSTSIDIKLRKSIAVGRISCSPRDIVGNSRGTPPACHTPRLTNSARCRRWTLQGASSDQLLHTPMTGRPSSSAASIPSICMLPRCALPGRPSARNHPWLRRPDTCRSVCSGSAVTAGSPRRSPHMTFGLVEPTTERLARLGPR